MSRTASPIENTEIQENDDVGGKKDLSSFTCERCGFIYQKVVDYPPHLCYRCMSFIAKRVWSIVQQIQPAGPSRTEVPKG